MSFNAYKIASNVVIHISVILNICYSLLICVKPYFLIMSWADETKNDFGVVRVVIGQTANYDNG